MGHAEGMIAMATLIKINSRGKMKYQSPEIPECDQHLNWHQRRLVNDPDPAIAAANRAVIERRLAKEQRRKNYTGCPTAEDTGETNG